MRIERTETLRYLRMGCVKPDAALESRLDRIENEIRSACRPAAYWRLEKIVRGDEPGKLAVGSFEVTSHDLSRVLDGCRHAFLFCATLGTEVDALIRRYSQMSGVDALIAQAAATAAIESWCDVCCKKMLAEPAVAGESLRSRYSPGYGDLLLETQRELLNVLDSFRRAGIVLTDCCLMIPSKSVSAVIGAGIEKDCEDPLC